MTKEIKKPSLYIAMPCYDMVKIQTMISMVKLVEQLTRAGIKKEVNTMKSPYVAYARNISVSYTHLTLPTIYSV